MTGTPRDRPIIQGARPSTAAGPPSADATARPMPSFTRSLCLFPQLAGVRPQDRHPRSQQALRFRFSMRPSGLQPNIAICDPARLHKSPDRGSPAPSHDTSPLHIQSGFVEPYACILPSPASSVHSLPRSPGPTPCSRVAEEVLVMCFIEAIGAVVGRPNPCRTA